MKAVLAEAVEFSKRRIEETSKRVHGSKDDNSLREALGELDRAAHVISLLLKAKADTLQAEMALEQAKSKR